MTEQTSEQGIRASSSAVTMSPSPAFLTPIVLLDDDSPAVDPGVVVLTCANCGAQMDERKCKLICRCGYFLSCSDYY
jgi:hypothetical protein